MGAVRGKEKTKDTAGRAAGACGIARLPGQGASVPPRWGCATEERVAWPAPAAGVTALHLMRDANARQNAGDASRGLTAGWRVEISGIPSTRFNA